MSSVPDTAGQIGRKLVETALDRGWIREYPPGLRRAAVRVEECLWSCVISLTEAVGAVARDRNAEYVRAAARVRGRCARWRDTLLLDGDHLGHVLT